MPKPQPVIDLTPYIPDPSDQPYASMQKINSLLYILSGSTNLDYQPATTDDMGPLLQKQNQLFYDRVASGRLGGAGGISYSLSEQDTGVLWIDGSKVYQTTVQFSSLTSGETAILHGIPNINNVIEIQGAAFDGTNYFRIPHVDPMYPTFEVGVWASATQLALRVGTGDLSAFTWVYLTMWYTCTDR